MCQHFVEYHGCVLANDDTGIGGVSEICTETDGTGVDEDAAAEGVGDCGGCVFEGELADEVIFRIGEERGARGFVVAEHCVYVSVMSLMFVTFAI